MYICMYVCMYYYTHIYHDYTNIYDHTNACIMYYI